MKERFTYKSAYYFPVAVCGGVAMVLLPIITALLTDSAKVGIILLVVTFILYVIALNIAARVPCSFEANEKEVIMTKLFRKRCIRYEDIESIKTENEFVDTLMLREDPYHLEKIEFVTQTDKISFTAKTRAVMQEDGSPLPFEDGMFEKLRAYIMRQVRHDEL